MGRDGMSIVCATDFSEPAAAGAAAGAALAAGLGERLCLVHVLAAPGTEAALEEVARERLGEVADGLNRRLDGLTGTLRQERP